jgi:dienelactone hydrolase
MKRLIFIIAILIFCLSSCEENIENIEIQNNTNETADNVSSGENATAGLEITDEAPDDEWTFYNKRAKTFINALAEGEYHAAADMFDEAMAQVYSVKALKDDWELITGPAGAFTAIYEIENDITGEYYRCLVTSHHTYMGVKMRVVFTEDGLVTGISAHGYAFTAFDSEPVQKDNFSQIPVVIGEGTDYPLNGLLTVPANASDGSKVPAVVLVHGSGSTAGNMDGKLYDNTVFRDIAEYLSSNGIAVIRYNKRTLVHGVQMTQELGGSATVYEETIEDAILAAEILKADPRIDENRIYILGYSLGGALAPRIHAEGGNFAGIISFAGTPRSIHEATFDQQMLYWEEMPDGEETKEYALSPQYKEDYYAEIEAIMTLPDDEAKKTPVGVVSAYYYQDWGKVPVSEYVKNITVPFLIMQGDNDFQVFADKDYVAWQELLSDRSNVTFKLYEGLNHSFMPSTITRSIDIFDEYKIKANVDAQVLKDIADWVKSN